MMNVFIAFPNAQYLSMFQEHSDYNIVPNIEDADLVLFTGGEDVNPALYGEKRLPRTYMSHQRDDEDLRNFHYCTENNIPMVGICRGGQFLNVMNGGLLFQDVNNHAIGSVHMATDTRTGIEVPVSSTHHQMMIPSEEGEVLLTAKGRSTVRYREQNGEAKEYTGEHEDTEAVYYPVTRSLCFQPHPEMVQGAYCRGYFFGLLQEFLGDI